MVKPETREEKLMLLDRFNALSHEMIVVAAELMDYDVNRMIVLLSNAFSNQLLAINTSVSDESDRGIPPNDQELHADAE